MDIAEVRQGCTSLGFRTYLNDQSLNSTHESHSISIIGCERTIDIQLLQPTTNDPASFMIPSRFIELLSLIVINSLPRDDSQSRNKIWTRFQGHSKGPRVHTIPKEIDYTKCDWLEKLLTPGIQVDEISFSFEQMNHRDSGSSSNCTGHGIGAVIIARKLRYDKIMNSLMILSIEQSQNEENHENPGNISSDDRDSALSGRTTTETSSNRLRHGSSGDLNKEDAFDSRVSTLMAFCYKPYRSIRRRSISIALRVTAK